jgi:diketogulonate reductase-like aldo/keto reductase
VRTVRLPSGEPVPVLGQGTWHLAEVPARWRDEVAALRLGIELGMTVIDTAEMYAEGRAEELVGEAVADRRDQVFLCSKVLPRNATRAGMARSCEASLRRLRTDRLDLYLLHWRGSTPLEETLAGFQALVQDGKTRYWGVSNFDLDDLEELVALDGGADVTTDQVLYNLAHRGIEWDLLPWCRDRGLPVMAYSPVDQGRFGRHDVLRDLARRHGVTVPELALAWVLRQDGVVAVPRTGSVAHVRENRAAAELQLTAAELEEVDRAFPGPDARQPLEVL